MLKHAELLNKVRELAGASKTEVVRACGYVTAMKDGRECLNFTAFYDALLQAKGVRIGGGAQGGRKLGFAAKVQGNGNLLVGKAYISQLGLAPGDQMAIEIRGGHIVLTAVEQDRSGSHERPAPMVSMGQYDPKATEARWQSAWERCDAFHPDPQAPGQPYGVVIPPPNVTGNLHMGHAFEAALMDAMVRFKRLQGYNTLCLPGMDHASIAVQTLLDKQLAREGTSKDQLGREAFLERAWAWKQESGGAIVTQLRRLGFSVDWRRERFTLDPELSRAVQESFLRLHEKGLIYRGEYLVNWCPASGSAVSDLEVEMKEVDGHLWYFRYPLTDGSGHLEVATTRPETMLGDVAVAVNPGDQRYAPWVGRTLTLPLVGRKIPVIADDHVDPQFGTGCVKVTPAHDANDFAMGQRHGLPLVTVMGKDGRMNEAAGQFRGLERFEARRAVVATLAAEQALVKVEDYRHTVPYSDRGNVPVEPLLSTQWFVRTKPLANACLAALNQGRPRFVPERWAKVYQNWLMEIRDWCISRQLWWGHRIPAWFVVSETGSRLRSDTPYVVARNVTEAQDKARRRYGANATIQQDEDVLDTWFSSALWPFSTMGWPDEESADLQRWYPNSTLFTGFDIIFFWVARMTMMGAVCTRTIPFADVYIHGLVRDARNRKMSKSAGNGIDPLVLCERYGADALRFSLVRGVAGAGQDIRLDFDPVTQTSNTVEVSRNFANKLWNATRFALLNLDGATPSSLGQPDPHKLLIADRWILSRLVRTSGSMAEKLDTYGLGEAARILYEFAWNDVCDWTIELLKRRLNGSNSEDRRTAQQVLALVIEQLLVLVHPFMPHVSEELWHRLSGADGDTFLALQRWPQLDPAHLNDQLEQQFGAVVDAVRVVRNLRAVAGLKPSRSADVLFVSDNEGLCQLLQETRDDIAVLTRAGTVDVSTTAVDLPRCLSAVSGELQILLPVGGLVDVDALRDRLRKDLGKAEKEISLLAEHLRNPGFLDQAPQEVVSRMRSNLSEAQQQQRLAQSRLASLG
ncbi:Valyl-tRNA synthetase (EC 6.1.1.9) [Candidatus Synechococcus spongiarum]|uniref:Valine--tRNA ligase n=2 Tax=Candidatus Synechococcus spongiarum TaxID=431041 RepID=A0A164YVQ3_9SYNE|nr:Valyl-tRNA synthetase (EC 6.1.1.9) [Candidatus Synechococcus spongiarum]